MRSVSIIIPMEEQVGGVDKNFLYTKKNFSQMSDVEICPPEVDMSEKRYDSMKNCYLVKELGDNWYIELNYDR